MSRPLKILVAEDDPNDIRMLRHAFTATGLDVPVQFVHDGQEAIDYLETKLGLVSGVPADSPAPTLLLLDLKMPRLSGFDVLEWIRRQPALHRMLVVVFTSSEEPQDRERAYSLGADAFFLKPEDPLQFVELVTEMEQHWLRLNATPECEFATE